MSDTYEELVESVDFYKKEIEQLENDRHFHIMCLSQAQDKIDEYEKELEAKNKELEKFKDK